MKIFKKVKDWLSRITLKKLGKLAKSAIVALVAKKLMELLKRVAENRSNVKEEITKAKNEFDTDRIIDEAFDKVEDGIEDLLGGL